jgi:cell wall-associated NlpC family hydrolase
MSEKARTYIDSLIGKPYKKDCYDKSGYDCWTLAVDIYDFCGISLPLKLHKKWNGAALDKLIKDDLFMWENISFQNRQFLDILLFNTSYRSNFHIGITLNQKYFIHALPSKGVVLNKFNQGFYAALIKWVYRWKNL